MENKPCQQSAVSALAVTNKMASKPARGDNPAATPKISKFFRKASGTHVVSVDLKIIVLQLYNVLHKGFEEFE